MCRPQLNKHCMTHLDGRHLPEEVLHVLVIALPRRLRRRQPRLKVAATTGAICATLRQRRKCRHWYRRRCFLVYPKPQLVQRMCSGHQAGEVGERV